MYTRFVHRLRQFMLVWRQNGAREAFARAVRKLAVSRQGTLPGAPLLPWRPDYRLELMLKFPRNDVLGKKPDPAGRQIVHWVIPDFSPGGGGHLTIFRFVYWLEYYGVDSIIWIYNPHSNTSEAAAKLTAFESYLPLRAKFRFLSTDIEAATGDLAMATDSWSVWPALAIKYVNSRSYFVQDLESRFTPAGSMSAVTDYSYENFDSRVTAGDWLRAEMERRGLPSSSFQLAVDHDVFFPPAEIGIVDRSAPIHIAFYARQHTERRAVELGWAAFLELHRRGFSFVVHAFGQETLPGSFPFEVRNRGLLTPRELRDLYHQCHVGVCFSATNYSLVPQEMSASGLPVVELDGVSTRSVYTPASVLLAKAHPAEIANAIAKVARDPSLREELIAKGLARVKGLNWKDEFSRVMPHLGLSPRLGSHPAVTVAIPTRNGGPRFERVVEMLRSQDYPGEVTVIVVDTESSDTTKDTAASLPNAEVISIAKSEFGHGRTRNLAASMASTKYVVFLTQDAVPTSRQWLFSLVQGMEAFPAVAGAFGAHRAHSEASPFVKRDIAEHFAHLRRFPHIVSEQTRNPGHSPMHWKQNAHYFSSNNCIIRTDVWKSVQFRNVNYGEDQLWARDILKAGYSRQYNPYAEVEHSHDYGEKEAESRARTEAAYFKIEFGYEIVSPKTYAGSLRLENERDTAFAVAAGIPAAELAKRISVNEAKYRGWLLGLNDTEVVY